MQVEGDTTVSPKSSEKAGANGAANGASLESHSLGQEAYSDDDDDDAHEEVTLASALLPCKESTTDDNCNGLEYIARV